MVAFWLDRPQHLEDSLKVGRLPGPVAPVVPGISGERSGMRGGQWWVQDLEAHLLPRLAAYECHPYAGDGEPSQN